MIVVLYGTMVGRRRDLDNEDGWSQSANPGAKVQGDTQWMFNLHATTDKLALLTYT